MTWLPHKEFLFDHALREALASNPQSPKGFNAKLTAHPYGINIQDTAPGWPGLASRLRRRHLAELDDGGGRHRDGPS